MRNHVERRFLNNQGFTLIELMVAMAVASIMLAAVVSLFTTLERSYTRQNAAANVQQ
ncbi:MAG: prepilin-type N-terminal cleavage/methylation domain-containing protein, partial [Desulfobulbaceae bacterium]|nr:prepilin-type N-terminal cleavage/methylation domain-containing protein [Desulfobulbaceae bacterium]